MEKLLTENSSLKQSPLKEIELEVVCIEKGKKVTRTISPVFWDLEAIRTVWEKCKQFDILFTDEIRGDFSKFTNILLTKNDRGELVSNGLFWKVDDFVGLLSINNIKPGIDGWTHFSFFDRRVRGREPLVRALMKEVFKVYKFRRLSIEIPDFSLPYLRDFISNVGFKKEGTRRKVFSYKGRMIDSLLYGILQEEVLNNAERN